MWDSVASVGSGSSLMLRGSAQLRLLGDLLGGVEDVGVGLRLLAPKGERLRSAVQVVVSSI